MSFAASLFAASYGGTQSMGSDGWITHGAWAGGGPTHAGIAVDEHKAMTFSAVYRAIALISEASSMLPIDVMQKVGDRRIERPEHPVAALLMTPNRLMRRMAIRAATQGHALGWGNGYQEIRRTEGGQPIELWPLMPDRTQSRAARGYNADGERELVYETTSEGRRYELQPSDVIHIAGPSFDGIRGYSPLRMHREAIGLGLGLQQFGASFFGNDARSGGFISHPGQLSEPAKENIRKSLQAQGGIEQAHRIKILEEGMTYTPSTLSPEDSQFLMTRSFQVEEIARVYGVPLHMLQSHEKSTAWGSGLAEMVLGFLKFTLGPWLECWEQELTRKLFTADEIRAGFFIRINVGALLRAEPKTRAEFYTKALNRATGWMSRAEVRALEDLNPDGIENSDPGPGQFLEGPMRGPPGTEPPAEDTGAEDGDA